MAHLPTEEPVRTAYGNRTVLPGAPSEVTRELRDRILTILGVRYQDDLAAIGGTTKVLISRMMRGIAGGPGRGPRMRIREHLEALPAKRRRLADLKRTAPWIYLQLYG